MHMWINTRGKNYTKGRLRDSNWFCRSNLSSPRCPATLLNLPNHGGHQEQRQETTVKETKKRTINTFLSLLVTEKLERIKQSRLKVPMVRRGTWMGDNGAAQSVSHSSALMMPGTMYIIFRGNCCFKVTYLTSLDDTQQFLPWNQNSKAKTFNRIVRAIIDYLWRYLKWDDKPKNKSLGKQWLFFLFQITEIK